MSTAEASPATAPAADEKRCCRPKSCCDKKGCGTDGKCCVCCRNALGYLGAILLTLAGFSALCLWMYELIPVQAQFLSKSGGVFSGRTLFFMSAGHWLGCNWLAPLLAVAAVVFMHLKCCARCAVRLLFTYGFVITLIALGGLLFSAVDVVKLMN